MKFVATKTTEQLDLQALHRVRERLVSAPASLDCPLRAALGDEHRPGRRNGCTARTKELHKLRSKR